MLTLPVKRGSLVRRLFGLRVRPHGRQDHLHLFSSPANAARLLSAYEDAVAGRGRVMTLDELRAEVGLEAP